MPATLVLDFDGTVCLGDGPVLAYGRHVAAALGEPAGRVLLAELAAYLAGGRPAAGWADGYQAVAALATGQLDAAAISRAYLASRQDLAASGLGVTAPPGLAELLGEVRSAAARVVVFTNSPAVGLDVTLDRLGLRPLIDSIVPDGRKPAGWAALWSRLKVLPQQVMSVGDFWANDIEPALRAGAATAFIDRPGGSGGPSHLRAATLDGLADGIRQWIADPIAFRIEHQLRTPELVANGAADRSPDGPRAVPEQPSHEQPTHEQ